LDIHTLHIEHVVLLALYTAITVANSWLYKGIKGIQWFSLYNLFALLGAIAVALRGQIPDFLSIVIGNLCVILAYYFFFVSLTAFFSARSSQYRIQIALFLVGCIAMAQYGWLHPDTRARLIAYSIVLGCQQAHIAVFLFRQRNQGAALRTATASMAVMMAILSLANVARLIGVSLQGVPDNYLAASPFLAWIVIINSCLQCGFIVSYVWMTAAHLRRDLEVQASTDPLTGLLNRRAIELSAEQQIVISRRDYTPVSAIVLDLDDFKLVNDSYGHHCGDAVLIAVANALQSSMRPNDLLARIGGDEFAVLLPATSLEAANAITTQLRSAIQQSEVVYGTITTSVTASFGFAQLGPSARNWEQLVMSCDKALYDAKRTTPPYRPDTPPSLSLAEGPR
jgi:diguanylate cyclase (GGDEF)-like protein